MAATTLMAATAESTADHHCDDGTFMRAVNTLRSMATDVRRIGGRRVPVSADVAGGIVVAALGVLHLYVLQVGGLVGFLVLLAGWPLVGGTVAARLSASDERVSALLAGAFGALVTALVVLLTGIAGMWPGFVTANFGVTLWPVTFTVFLLLAITWTVFGYVAGYVSEGR